VKRWPLRILLCLILGAITTIAVAWRLAWTHSTDWPDAVRGVEGDKRDYRLRARGSAQDLLRASVLNRNETTVQIQFLLVTNAPLHDDMIEVVSPAGFSLNIESRTQIEAPDEALGRRGRFLIVASIPVDSIAASSNEGVPLRFESSSGASCELLIPFGAHAAGS